MHQSSYIQYIYIYIYIYSFIYVYTRKPGRSPTLKHTPCAVSCLFWKTVFWLLDRFFDFFGHWLLRYILYTCSNLWKRSCSKCYTMDCLNTPKNLTTQQKWKKTSNHGTVWSANVPVCTCIYIYVLYIYILYIYICTLHVYIYYVFLIHGHSVTCQLPLSFLVANRLNCLRVHYLVFQ